MNKCQYCHNAINPSNHDQRFCNPIHAIKFQKNLDSKNYAECPSIKNRDILTDKEKQLQQKFIKKIGKKQAKEKLFISGGGL